jgi:2-C-methyl-D-erythritol 4-phosphate cytidylyltransferase
VTVPTNPEGLWAIVPLPISVAHNKPSAFAPLAGESPVLRVVRALGVEAAVVVAVAEPLVGEVRTILDAHEVSSTRVAAVSGAGTRAHCLIAALELLEGEPVSPRHVLVHDIRQPLISSGVRSRVIASLLGGDGVVVPALPVTDSVKAVDAQGSVTGTLDRSTLRAVQYPRGFAVDQLAALLARRVSDDFDDLDEALRAGVPITVVEGDSHAFVAELPRDTPFVEAIIAGVDGS